MEGRLTRRDVLRAGAGVAAGGALASGGLSPALLRALAATQATCGSLADVKNMVIFIQENRSFDHYFGRYKGARGFDDRSVRLSATDDGTTVFKQRYPANTIPGTPEPLLPFHIDTTEPSRSRGACTNDIGHQWADQHAIWKRLQLRRGAGYLGPVPAADQPRRPPRGHRVPSADRGPGQLELLRRLPRAGDGDDADHVVRPGQETQRPRSQLLLAGGPRERAARLLRATCRRRRGGRHRGLPATARSGQDRLTAAGTSTRSYAPPPSQPHRRRVPMYRGRSVPLVVVVWLVVGAIVSGRGHYFDNLGSVGAILTAILAVLLWPLILVGVKIHITT